MHLKKNIGKGLLGLLSVQILSVPFNHVSEASEEPIAKEQITIEQVAQQTLLASLDDTSTASTDTVTEPEVPMEETIEVAEEQNKMSSEMDLSTEVTTENLAPSTTETTESIEKTETSTVESVESISDGDIRPTAENGIQDVDNWVDFIKAIADTTVSTINITGDFETPDNPVADLSGIATGETINNARSLSFVRVNAAAISRTLTIEGNNHQIDFRAVTLRFNDITATTASPWHLIVKDLEIFHGNYYGPITFDALDETKEPFTTLTYHNIKHVGNQLVYSPQAKVELSGKTTSQQQSMYTSKFREDWRINETTHTNIYAAKLTILANAEVELSTINAGNIHLGANEQGDFHIEAGAKLTAIANGTTSTALEAYGANLYVVKGNTYISDSAQVTFIPQKVHSAISLMAESATLNVGTDAQLQILTDGRTATSDGSNVNLIYMVAESALIVEDGAVLEVKAMNHKALGSHLIYVDGAATIEIGQEATLKVELTDQVANPAHLIYVDGAATVKIGKDATLDLQSDSTSPTQHLLHFTDPTSIFSFADAKWINLQRTASITGTNGLNGLIYIDGSDGLLNINVQAVKQWHAGNFEDTPDHDWTPIFNLQLRYASMTAMIENVASILDDTVEAFKQSFTTQNVQRVLFEKITDVTVTINELTAEQELAHSYVITGRANPGSLIRFSGDSAIPVGQVDSTDISDLEKYHVRADANGDYRYELPTGSFFTGGKTVSAYAFLNGANNTAQTVVQENVVNPKPVDPVKPEEEVRPENPPEIPENQGLLSLDFVSQFNFGTQKISVQDQTYYAQPQRLLNEDGSVQTEVRPNYIQISDRRAESEQDGWQLSVVQERPFTGAKGQELKGATLRLGNQQVTATQTDNAPALENPDATITLVSGQRQPLLSAEKGEGTGTWIYRFGDQDSADKSVSLIVPSNAAPDQTTYTTTLTWELSAIPGNDVQ